MNGTWTDGIGFRHLPAADGEWTLGVRPGLAGHFQSRELGLAAASGGAIKLQHIRAVDPRVSQLAPDWHVHKLDLQLLCVLEGSMTIEHDDGHLQPVRRGDAGFISTPNRHRERAFTTDYELFELTSPAVFETVYGDEAATLTPPARWSLADVDVDGRRLRDLGVHRVGGRSMHFRLVGPAAPDRWPGDHQQMAVVTRGSATLATPAGPAVALRRADAVFFDAGVAGAHRLASSSDDFELLQLCVTGA